MQFNLFKYIVPSISFDRDYTKITDYKKCDYDAISHYKDNLYPYRVYTKITDYNKCDYDAISLYKDKKLMDDIFMNHWSCHESVKNCRYIQYETLRINELNHTFTYIDNIDELVKFITERKYIGVSKYLDKLNTKIFLIIEENKDVDLKDKLLLIEKIIRCYELLNKRIEKIHTKKFIIDALSNNDISNSEFMKLYKIIPFKQELNKAKIKKKNILNDLYILSNNKKEFFNQCRYFELSDIIEIIVSNIKNKIFDIKDIQELEKNYKNDDSGLAIIHTTYLGTINDVDKFIGYIKSKKNYLSIDRLFPLIAKRINDGKLNIKQVHNILKNFVKTNQSSQLYDICINVMVDKKEFEKVLYDYRNYVSPEFIFKNTTNIFLIEKMANSTDFVDYIMNKNPLGLRPNIEELTQSKITYDDYEKIYCNCDHPDCQTTDSVHGATNGKYLGQKTITHDIYKNKLVQLAIFLIHHNNYELFEQIIKKYPNICDEVNYKLWMFSTDCVFKNYLISLKERNIKINNAMLENVNGQKKALYDYIMNS